MATDGPATETELVYGVSVALLVYGVSDGPATQAAAVSAAAESVVAEHGPAEVAVRSGGATFCTSW